MILKDGEATNYQNWRSTEEKQKLEEIKEE